MNNELYITTIALARQHLEEVKKEGDIYLIARFIREIEDLQLQHYIFISATTNTKEEAQ